LFGCSDGGRAAALIFRCHLIQSEKFLTNSSGSGGQSKSEVPAAPTNEIDAAEVARCSTPTTSLSQVAAIDCLHRRKPDGCSIPSKIYGKLDLEMPANDGWLHRGWPAALLETIFPSHTRSEKTGRIVMLTAFAQMIRGCQEDRRKAVPTSERWQIDLARLRRRANV